MKMAKLITEVEKRRNQIGKARDELRDLISDAEVLAESCNEAVLDLDGAIRALQDAEENLSQYA